MLDETTRCGLATTGLDQLVVFGMWTDPYLHEVGAVFDCLGAK